MESVRLAAVSVDLDELDLYRDLHALPQRASALVYEIALARAAAFAKSEGIELSLFAVGRDLERAESAACLAELANGHEVENHSYHHRYDLAEQSVAAIEDDVARAQEVLAKLTGRRPRGFRAPGYRVSDALLDALERQGLLFDSSVFPCPPYYLAKAAALGWMALLRRQSAARLDTPRVMVAPSTPYRPGRPWYRRGGRGLLELPIGVTRVARLPFIGTALALAGVRGARALARWCVGSELVNLELHGIDFLDAGDGLADLAPYQPDVKVPVGQKQRAFGAALDVLRAAGYRFVTLARAADELSGVVS